MKAIMKAILREPLFHILLAGFAIFALSAWRGDYSDPESRTIMIDEQIVSRLAASWQQTWQRPPTPTELDGLISDYIKEEIYYREAMRMGLDKDDAVIRRRLRSKMEYLASAEVESARPDDANLQAWLDRNPARYQMGAEYSFDQIYLGDIEPAKAQANAAALKTKLVKGADWQQLGSTIALPRSMDKIPLEGISKNFGDNFAAALATETAQKGTNIWIGPVPSGFGFHLVRVRAVSSTKKPSLAEVRQAVENDWRSSTSADREAKGYRTLLDQYTIKITKP